jgi:hypothetical protein
MLLRDRDDSSLGLRPLLGAVTLVLAIAVLASPDGAAARGRTFVANCGNPSFLEVEPVYWSAGCTAGAAYVKPLQWIRYGRRRAVARGTAIVQDCGCSEPTVVGRYPARLTFTRPRRCPGGSSLRYFAKVRLTVTYPKDNPFGKSAGPLRAAFPPSHGDCGVTP